MAKVKCVHCNEMVFEMAPECPKCGKPVANRDAPVNVPSMNMRWNKKSMKGSNPVPLVLSGIAVISVIAAVLYISLF